MNCMVTGVSRGIGRATITELMRQGHSVWGVSRTSVPDLCKEEQGRFRHSLCDVGNPESRKRVAEEMDAAGFWPDAVILNAAVEYEEEKTALSWERMQEVLQINVEGALFWISHWMDRHPRRSMQFVGVSSLVALWPDADCPAYSASKAALSMALRALRLRYADGQIAFKLLYLGPVHTSINPRFASKGPPGRIVAKQEAVARYIVNTVLAKRHFTFYYPLSTALVCRFGGWMPDLLFERITRPLRR
jgi:short-subunit dehydrogenase